MHLPASGGGDGAKKVKGDYESAPRGITAKPGQKGSYGTRGTTISESHSKFGVANEFAHKTGDHYDAARELEKERRQRGKKKEQSNPFRPAALGKKGGPGVRGTTLGGPKGTCWVFPKSRLHVCPYNTDTFLAKIQRPRRMRRVRVRPARTGGCRNLLASRKSLARHETKHRADQQGKYCAFPESRTTVFPHKTDTFLSQSKAFAILGRPAGAETRGGAGGFGNRKGTDGGEEGVRADGCGAGENRRHALGGQDGDQPVTCRVVKLKKFNPRS